MTSRAPGATEPYKAVWASLIEKFRQRRELLDEVASKGDWTEEQRRSAALSMLEPQIEALASALWRAEEELREAQRVVRELTAPKGAGHKRMPEPDDKQRFADKVRFRLHCAALDRKPDGKKLTPREAIRQLLVEEGRGRRKNLVDKGRAEPNDPNAEAALESAVAAALDAAVLAYKRRYPLRRKEGGTPP
jgi:hypothetical protein